MTYVAHSAQRKGGRESGRARARCTLHVPCPTCRMEVAGEFELAAFSGGRVGSEQYERLAVPGSEPGDPPTYIPRVPRIAFPEHVDREDGRLREPTRDEGRGHGTRASSQGGAPAEPAPARLPPQPQGGRGAPVPQAARGSATDDRRPMDGSDSNVGYGQGTGTGGSGAAAMGVAGRAVACEVPDVRTTGVPGGRSYRSRSSLA